MSNFSTVYDVLLHNPKIHARIAEFYRALAAEANSERVQMLLNLLVKHELELMITLRDCIEKAPAKVRDTFFNLTVNIAQSICLLPSRNADTLTVMKLK
jgi:hypothetical protein